MLNTNAQRVQTYQQTCNLNVRLDEELHQEDEDDALDKAEEVLKAHLKRL